MKMEGGMMKMDAVDKLALPAGKAVELKPGGYHVMLMDLVKPLKEGDTVPLQLTFEDKAGKKQTVEVKAEVKALTTGGTRTRAQALARPGSARRSAIAGDLLSSPAARSPPLGIAAKQQRFALTAQGQHCSIGLTT